jgi:hemerythrin-like metal-binding protein
MVNSAIGKSAHSINVIILDDQHEVLFENLRLLEEAMQRGEGAAEVPKILDNLVELKNYHFPTEERLMQTYEYPLRDSHAIEHHAFFEHFRKMSSLVSEGDRTVAIQLVDLLYHWLENHVMNWDARLGEYLNDRGVT